MRSSSRLIAPKPGPNYVSAPLRARPTLKGHIQIARPDHWFKNVFVLPGIAAAVLLDPSGAAAELPIRILIGMAAVCLVASSNYVLNELSDAPFDRSHPTKRERPVPLGQISVPLAYAEWIVLMLLGVSLGLAVSIAFAMTMGALWAMGCLYNLPPIRTKNTPYLDVVSEAVNNALRMLAGWFIAGTPALPPTSLLLSSWMIGCYFMAIKRYAEYRDLADPLRAAAYRRSFGFYTEERLMVSIMFYASAAMLFLGAFIMRYRLELILTFPLVALVMAIYLFLAFKRNSAVQSPERLYREPSLMIAVAACVLAMGILLIVDLPILRQLFAPSVFAQDGLPPH